jgi:hypothetical protein
MESRWLPDRDIVPSDADADSGLPPADEALEDAKRPGNPDPALVTELEPAGDETIREGRAGGIQGGPHSSQGQGQGG